MPSTVVYIGGPRAGVVEAIPQDPLEAPLALEIPTLESPLAATPRIAIYERRELADTPGRIAYVYQGRRDA